VKISYVTALFSLSMPGQSDEARPAHATSVSATVYNDVWHDMDDSETCWDESESARHFWDVDLSRAAGSVNLRLRGGDYILRES
jgi:hypothetical protein